MQQLMVYMRRRAMKAYTEKEDLKDAPVPNSTAIDFDALGLMHASSIEYVWMFLVYADAFKP
jgi:hypothetical protein